MPMRNRPGSAPTSSTKGRTGAGALYQHERVRTGDDVQHGGGIGHRVGDDALDRRAVPALGQRGHATAADLEPDQPAAGCGDPDRSAAVIGMGEGEHPERRWRPPRRSSRPACGRGSMGCA